MMPATAEDLEINNPTDPAQSLIGGTSYLKQIYDKFENIPNRVDRQKFTMASYNCGYGHILDAQRLARKNDLDPEVWDNNVEEMLLKLRLPKYYNKPFIRYGYVRGTEPVKYVNEIFDRYEHYKKFFD